MVNKALRVAPLALAGILAVGAPRAEAQGSVLVLDHLATFAADPIGVFNAGDGSGRLFVVLQRGQIMIYESGGVRPTPFLDIRSKVSCCGEQGLLGLVFHPNYEANGRFYVNYTDLNGDTVVARFLVSADPNVANPA
jgi:Glucose / Sorbosone dehydrogenase